VRHTIWQCACGEFTTVRHYIQRDGVLVHDPDAAYREAAGLVAPEPAAPVTNESD
jgi:hypothetical protein